MKPSLLPLVLSLANLPPPPTLPLTPTTTTTTKCFPLQGLSIVDQTIVSLYQNKNINISNWLCSCILKFLYLLYIYIYFSRIILLLSSSFASCSALILNCFYIFHIIGSVASLYPRCLFLCRSIRALVGLS